MFKKTLTTNCVLVGNCRPIQAKVSQSAGGRCPEEDCHLSVTQRWTLTSDNVLGWDFPFCFPQKGNLDGKMVNLKPSESSPSNNKRCCVVVWHEELGQQKQIWLEELNPSKPYMAQISHIFWISSQDLWLFWKSSINHSLGLPASYFPLWFPTFQ